MRTVIQARPQIIVPLAMGVLALGGVLAWRSWESTRPVLAPIGPARVQPQILCGGGAVIVLAPDGSLWGWGSNVRDQLGRDPRDLVPRPCRLSAGTSWATVAANSQLALAVGIKTDGTLWGWKLNAFEWPRSFLKVNDDRDWCHAIVGQSNVLAFALKTNGTLWAWIWGGSGPTMLGPMPSDSQLVQAGTNSAWASVGASSFDSWGLRRDGTLWRLGLGPLEPSGSQLGKESNWVSLQAGSSFSLARKADGHWWARGPNVPFMLDLPVTQQPTQFVCLPQSERWEVVAGGRNHLLGLTRNGSMRALGMNAFGQLGDGTTNNHTVPVEVATDNVWVAMGAGDGYSVGLAADGSLWTWGQRVDEDYVRRSKFVEMLGSWARRLGMRAAWADLKPPGFDTKPRCVLRFTTDAAAAGRLEGTASSVP
jgi:alpha-tubulin suppressor-like RCC1 family protein